MDAVYQGHFSPSSPRSNSIPYAVSRVPTSTRLWSLPAHALGPILETSIATSHQEKARRVVFDAPIQPTSSLCSSHALPSTAEMPVLATGPNLLFILPFLCLLSYINIGHKPPNLLLFLLCFSKPLTFSTSSSPPLCGRCRHKVSPCVLLFAPRLAVQDLYYIYCRPDII